MNEDARARLRARLAGGQASEHSSLPRILVVDDEPENCQAIERALRGRYRCHCFHSAEEALAGLVDPEGISLALVDQRMPGMQGLELLERLRADYPALVRVLITGFSEASVFLRAVNSAESFRVLVKPWKAGELEQTVEESMAYREVLQRQARARAALKAARESLGGPPPAS